MNSGCRCAACAAGSPSTCVTRSTPPPLHVRRRVRHDRGGRAPQALRQGGAAECGASSSPTSPTSSRRWSSRSGSSRCSTRARRGRTRSCSSGAPHRHRGRDQRGAHGAGGARRRPARPARARRARSSDSRRRRATRARARGAQGGTFTVTSTGAKGGLLATPIIHHPQVAILGVHEVKKTPVVVDEQIVTREITNLSLSLDHRVVDGAVGADFLYDVIARLEDPCVADAGGDRMTTATMTTTCARCSTSTASRSARPPRFRTPTCVAMLRHMLKLRALDQRMLTLQRQGRIGFYGTATGQEAAITGSAYALRPTRLGVPGAARDWACSLWRGTTVQEVVAPADRQRRRRAERPPDAVPLQRPRGERRSPGRR